MPLKNKDGTAYQLRKPNPLVTGQASIWNEELILHNLSPHKAQEIPEAPQVAEVKVEEAIPTPEPTSTRAALENILIFHCLPARMEERRDELYGDKWLKTVYGSKLTFEGVITDQNDLQISFWTTYEVTPGTIVYPYRWRSGEPYGDRRWWKVSDTKKMGDGTLAEAIFSDYNPDFS